MALLVRSEGDRIEVRDADLDGVERGDEDTIYTLRPITKSVAREIEKRHRKEVFDRQTHQKQATYDNEGIWLDKLDYALVNWSGVLFKDSREPVPCTREYKELSLDLPRQVAILKLAGVNEVARDDASFRQSA